MTPRYYTINKKDGSTIFHYPLSVWKDYIKQGRETGDVGAVLIKRNGNKLTYRCFGTIEHPLKSPQTLTMVHNNVLDGKLPSDNELCKEPQVERPEHSSYSFLMFNLSGDGK